MKKTILLALVLLAVPSAFCVGPATDHPASVAILLGLDSVRSDLKVSPAQAAQLDEIRSNFRSKSRTIVASAGSTDDSLRAANERLNALRDTTTSQALQVLSQNQKIRLTELETQLLGASVLVSPKLQKKLQLSPAQISTIEDIRVKGVAAVDKINAQFRDGKISHHDRITELRSRRLSDAENLLGVLTPSQRELFLNSTGKPLKVS